ncbi:hypothetical protein KIPB_012975, partial [Kipferlia bialata]|eukprot:g12975.t1
MYHIQKDQNLRVALESNGLLREIMTNTGLMQEIEGFVRFAGDCGDLCLFIPQARLVTECTGTANKDMLTEFCKAHIVAFNSQRPWEYASMSGVRGQYNEKGRTLSVLLAPPDGKERMRHFADKRSVF